MHYERMRRAVFLERANRFIGRVLLDGEETVCHVKNTGRCRELLIPGAEIWVQETDNPDRKTKYDLISVRKGDRLVNMDSQAPNQAVYEWLEKGGLDFLGPAIRREVVFGASRLDLFACEGERQAFIEVKGVTLEEEGTAYFPDAPTERGLKHIRELEACVSQGYEAWLIFVIQMKGVRLWRPNYRTHPAFGRALVQAARAGVRVIARDCQVTETDLSIDGEVPVIFL